MSHVVPMYSFLCRTLQFLLFLSIFCSSLAGPVTKCPEKCHCFKRNLDCSSRGLRDVPYGIPKATLHLDLSNNDLSELDVTRFTHLRRLSTLDLSNNRLSTSSVERGLVVLGKLTVLDLRRNLIDRIPANLHLLEKLVRLEMRGNNISTISAGDVQMLSMIREVDLSKNQIISWKFSSADSNFLLDGRRQLVGSHIESLDLSLNAINQLPPDAFSNMGFLQRLSLASNRLENVSSTQWNGLRTLQSLDISRNSIAHLPSLAFNTTPQLTNLSLAENRINRLDDGVFFKAYQLTTLNLSSNLIHNISGGWHYGLSELQTLDLSSNRIGWVDAASWQNVADLRELRLGHNGLRMLPSGAFSSLRKLHTLGLQANGLESLHKTALSGLDQLWSLDLSSNALAVCLEDGAVLYNTSLPFLKELRFSNNSLKALPARAFARFPALEVLDLRHNPIATMLKGSFEPLALKTFYLNTSSLLCDCKLDWWAAWLYQSRLDKRHIETRCSHPAPLVGINVAALDVANLTCVDDSPRPRITSHPPPQTKTMIGSEAHVDCAGYGEAPLWLEWRLTEIGGKSRVIFENSDPRFLLTVTEIPGVQKNQMGLSGQLTLTNAQLSDRAEYQCVVRNQFGADYSNRTFLEVQQIPVFTSEPDDLALLVGQNAKIACSATGVPTPVIKWQKDGGESFLAAAERRLHVYSHDEHLYIISVKPEDSGVYTCHAVNDAGHQQASATLRIYDNYFRSPLQDLEVAEGDTVALDCTADLQPGQRVQWIHEYPNGDTEVVYPSTRLSLLARDQLLLLVKATHRDSGRYSCELWAGAHLLAAQRASITVFSASAPVMERLLIRQGHLNITLGQLITIVFLATLLGLGFICCLTIFIIYYRRAARDHRRYRARSYGPVNQPTI
ncbi:unnamed protein product, partial [Mesorhabditis spiculigera]